MPFDRIEVGNRSASGDDHLPMTPAPTGVAPATVALTSVSCRLGSTQALDDVSLVAAPGEHLAIIGPNGAGKSTLLRSILGLVRVHGRIDVDGVVAGDAAGWRERRRVVAWVPQRPAVGRFPLLVRELLASSGHVAAAIRAADDLGVGGVLDRPLHTLSGGQLQRAYLARGLGHVAAGARLLLADEPTSALDFATRDLVAERLLGVPVTLITVTHDAGIAERADRVVEMAAGVVRDLAPAEGAA